jgi:aspartate/methionine/tyrosine aminotransferase
LQPDHDANLLRFLKDRVPNWSRNGTRVIAYSGVSCDALLRQSMVGWVEDYHRLAEAGTTFRYQWGLTELQDQIRKRYHLPATVRVLPTAGASAAIHCAYQGVKSFFGGTRAELLIEEPFYDPMVLTAEMVGFKVRTFPRRLSDWSIDVNAIAERLTPPTRLVVLTNLHNPTSNWTEPSTLREIDRTVNSPAEIRRRGGHECFILVDETFADFRSEPPPAPAVTLGRRFISISGLTKAYGLGMLRCGWVLARDPALVTHLEDARLFTQNIGSLYIEYPAAQVFDDLSPFIARRTEVLETNRKRCRQFLQEVVGLLEGDVPDHGCVWFPRLTLPKPRCRQLLERWSSRTARVAVGPGRFFGRHPRFDQYIRIGFGGAPLMLAQGLQLLEADLKK